MEKILEQFIERRDALNLDYLPGRLRLRWIEKFLHETNDDVIFEKIQEEGQ